MKPSITYLHLLRHTPFFTLLSADQLRWTIEHSKEWEAQPRTEVVACSAGDERPDDAIWILLDGRWQLEKSGRDHVSGHADPGKWFSASAMRGPCRLVTTEQSYVMRITRSDMEEMLKRGFAFQDHLHEGRAYYEAIDSPTLR